MIMFTRTLAVWYAGAYDRAETEYLCFQRIRLEQNKFRTFTAEQTLCEII